MLIMLAVPVTAAASPVDITVSLDGEFCPGLMSSALLLLSSLLLVAVALKLRRPRP